MADAKQPDVMWILWGAFLVTHAAFLGIGQVVEPTEPTEDIGMMAMVLTGVGTMTALGAVFGVTSFLKGSNYQTTMLMRFAMAESAAIFGFVLAMLGAEPMWTFILAGLGVVAHLAVAPTQRDREAHGKSAA